MVCSRANKLWKSTRRAVCHVLATFSLSSAVSAQVPFEVVYGKDLNFDETGTYAELYRDDDASTVVFYVQMNKNEPGTATHGRIALACISVKLFPKRAVQVHTKHGGDHGTRRWIVFCAN